MALQSSSLAHLSTREETDSSFTFKELYYTIVQFSHHHWEWPHCIGWRDIQRWGQQQWRWLLIVECWLVRPWSVGRVVQGSDKGSKRSFIPFILEWTEGSAHLNMEWKYWTRSGKFLTFSSIPFSMSIDTHSHSTNQICCISKQWFVSKLSKGNWNKVKHICQWVRKP